MVEESVSTASAGLDINSLLKSAIAGDTMSDLFGGKSDGNGFVMGALLGRLLFNNGNDLNGNSNSQSSAIDSAVASALASANQANNNSMLLLKDIQDSSQEVISTVTTAAQTQLIQDLQSQIATLNAVNNSTQSVVAAVDGVARQIDNVTLSVAQGQADINSNIANTRFDVTLAVNNDGDKTRAAIAALAASIPNAREIELQRQLGVAEAQLLHRNTADLVRSGNVEVTNNINQNQNQQQQQQQLWNINNVLQDLLTAQKVTQGIVNLGTMTGNSQTAANTRVNS